VIVVAWEYSTLTLLAALATAPLIVLASLSTKYAVAAEAVDWQPSDP
jgi:hypothetical protein